MAESPSNTDPKTDALQRVRDMILNQTIVVMAFLSLPTAFASLNRVKDIGWQPLMVVQLAAVVVIVLLALFRKKTPYALRSVIILGELLILGGAGLYNLGIVSNLTFLLVFIVYVSVLYGTRGGLLSVLGTMVLLSIFAVLITQEIIRFDINFELYQLSASTWFSRILSIGVFSSMIVLAAGQLHNALANRIDQLEIEIIKRQQAQQEIEDYRDHLEQLVQQRTEELQAINQELESFSYSVSHDLRAPLRAISGFSKIIQDNARDTLDAESLDYLGRTLDATQKMDNMITGLLDLSRITREPLEMVPLDLSEIAAGIVKDLQREHPDQQVEVRISLGLQAQGDESLVRVLLQNLIHNAWKFSQPQETARIVFSAAEEHNQQTFFVKDNGVGFDTAYAQNLFAPFQRLHPESEFKGYGIGLATCRRIVQRHGGKIWAEAEPGKGATFYFTLPEG